MGRDPCFDNEALLIWRLLADDLHKGVAGTTVLVGCFHKGIRWKLPDNITAEVESLGSTCINKSDQGDLTAIDNGQLRNADHPRSCEENYAAITGRDKKLASSARHCPQHKRDGNNRPGETPHMNILL